MQIRNIDVAGRLGDRAGITRACLRALLWGVPLYFGGALLGAALLEGDNLPLAEWPAALAEPLAVALLLLALNLALLASGKRLARLGAALVLVMSALWILESALQSVQMAAGGPFWQAGAGLRLLIVSWASVECGLGAWALMRSARADLMLVRQPVGPASLIGAPPALSFLTAGRLVPSLLFIAVAFVSAFAMMQTVMLNNSAALSWDLARSHCGDRLPCLQDAAWGDAFGLLLVWPVTFLVAVVLGRRLRRVARERVHRSAAEAMRIDTRPPILYLRWFGNDEGQLRRGARSPMGWLLGLASSEASLDRLLVEQFSALGPTVALGKPGTQDRKTAGVWRHFASNDEWHAELERLCVRAGAIVMSVDLAVHTGTADISSGVRTELHLLARPELRAKTLLLTGPQSTALEHHSRVWQSIAEHGGFTLPAMDPTTSARPLGAFIRSDGSLAVAMSARFSHHEYAATLRWFFDSLPGSVSAAG